MTVEKFNAKWDAKLALVSQPVDSPTLYSLRRHQEPFALDYRGEVHALRIRYIGRWGNYVISLAHLFHVAELISVKRVYLVPTEMFPLRENIVISGIEICPASSSGVAGDYELEGQFFFPESLGSFLRDFTPERRASLSKLYIKPLMVDLTYYPRMKSGLAIHVRSGDIFQGRDGEGGTGLGGALYTQPPLCFYELAADAAFKGQTGHIDLVSENSFNPIIFPLVSALERRGHSVTLRLNHALNDDIGFLFSASKVAFAAGTIGMAISMLSDCLTEAFFFRHQSTGTYLPVEEYVDPSVLCHFANSTGEVEYIAVGDWRNTPTQRRLMTSYPKYNLVWEDDCYRAPINVALNKPASQSSAYIGYSDRDCCKAVNGQKTGSFSFHTDYEPCAWWQVDLESEFSVCLINIYNRLAFAERARTIKLFVRGNEGHWRLIHDQRGEMFGGLDGHPLSIDLSEERFRFMRIQLAEANYLHLDEVELWIKM